MTGVLLTACQFSAPTPVAWAGTPTARALAATQTAFAATQQSYAALPTAAPSSTPTQTDDMLLPSATPAPDGPWLIYPAADGQHLKAYDRDLHSTNAINTPALLDLNDLTLGVSPNGLRLVVRAGSELVTDELALYFIENPLEGWLGSYPLLSIALQRELVNGSLGRNAAALLAVGAENSLQWSHDGQYLAFIAARDGDSSDLYRLNWLTGMVERLTARYQQDALPAWSPDDGWLITQEFEVAADLSTWQSLSAWALRMPKLDETRALYVSPQYSQQERILGWINNLIYTSYSQTAEGKQDLRQVDIDSMSTTPYFRGGFNQAAFDPAALMLVIVLDEAHAQNLGWQAGIYSLAHATNSFVLQRSGNWQHLTWDEGGRMFIAGSAQGAYGFSASGSQFMLERDEFAAFSPDGNRLIGYGSQGIHLYTAAGSFLQQLSDVAVKQLIWQADSRAFYVLTETGIYRLDYPAFKLQLVDASVHQGDDFAWTWLGK